MQHRKIVYIGNNLSAKTKYIPTLVVLSNLLIQEGHKVSIASNKNNKILRILDMIWAVAKNFKKTDVVLIDTFAAFNFDYALVISQVCRFLKSFRA